MLTDDLRRVLVISLAISLSAVAWASNVSILDGFDPDVNGTVNTLAIQADGKILMGGEFTTIDGLACNRIARLIIDGSPDPEFNSTGTSDTVNAICVQPSGKILVGGNFTIINHESTGRIARLNANGSLDVSFNAGSGANGAVLATAAQPDGKVIIGGRFTTVNGASHKYIARLNSDGSLDPTFLGPGASFYVNALALEGDGKIIVGGQFSSINGAGRPRVARLNADGTVDTKFNTGSGPNNTVNTVSIQPDGKVLIGGAFTQVNGVGRNGIARLNTNGTLDTSYDTGTGANNTVNAIVLQPDGKALMGGLFTTISGKPCNRFGRLNFDGALDTTFGDTMTTDSVNAIAIQWDNKPLYAGAFTQTKTKPCHRIARLNLDNTLDSDFNQNVNSNYIHQIATQPNGKILATVLIDGRLKIVRLNADGTTDTTFKTAELDMTIRFFALRPDGKIWIGGFFNSINGIPRNKIAQLNPDGSLNSTVLGVIGSTYPYVETLLVLKDGKLLLCGTFDKYNGVTSYDLIRLYENAAIDHVFDECFNGNSPPNNLCIQPDGKVIVVGQIRPLGGTGGVTIWGDYLYRLNTDCTKDTTLNIGTGPNSYVKAIILQPDGRNLIGGSFTQFDGIPRNQLARLHPDGSLDLTYAPVKGYFGDVSCMAFQSDNKLLLPVYTGLDDLVTRFNADGSTDSTLDSEGAAHSSGQSSAVLRADGKLLIGGSSYNLRYGFPWTPMVCITNPDAALQKLTVTPGGSAVTWTLGGSFPWPYQVLFEESSDGTSWNDLGWGVSVPGIGYRLTGLKLPAKTNHYIRATGWYTGGEGNRSTSLTRSVLLFYDASEPKNAAGDWSLFK